MVAGIWNIRGVGKKGVSSCLNDIIADNKLDFNGLQETMKKDYKQSFFRKIDPGNNFFWKWIPSIGKSGGILCGVRYEVLEVQTVKLGEFMILMFLWDKIKKCRWAAIVVYGPAHDNKKDEFLAELSLFCNSIDCPYFVGGDFNILRTVAEKNKPCVLSHYSDTFNSIIHTLCLREIHMTGGLYTWSNKQKNPTLEKLDRILMSPDWELLFPLVSVKRLVRDQSDHNPLVLDTGDTILPVKKRSFKFDTIWLKNDEFLPKVESIWKQQVNSSDPIDVLNIKLKRFKKYFKGWGSNVFGHMKKRKVELLNELGMLEGKEENNTILPDEVVRRTAILVELYNVYAEEESYWHQRSHARWLLHGDKTHPISTELRMGEKEKMLSIPLMIMGFWWRVLIIC
jgi:exonuclease III